MPYTLILQDLKRLILAKAGIKIISPSDCRVISISIQQELRKNISETTIKRLFGFAEIKHDFSKFTINTLKEYVGVLEEQVEDSTVSTIITNEDLSQIRAKALRISQYTLQNLKNRCTVPYEMTVPRKFARHDFDFFYNSNFNFTAFVSQPGYGKSILISHLVQEMFFEKNAPHQNDIVLLINADHIFNSELFELSLEDRIKQKLGLNPETDLIRYFDEHWKTSYTKFVVIIDGFSELIIKKIYKPQIFDRLLGFIGAIDGSDNIKLIFTMRSTTWNRFYERMRYSHFLKKKWFTGSYFNLRDSSNVPPLNEVEVKQIFEQLSDVPFDSISEKLKSQLKFPFHIQWYYLLKEEYANFESYTNIVFFEIIARFIQEKVYNSTYATEKVSFCKKLIHLTNYGRKENVVLKADLIKEFPVFKNAYMELLADGILVEERRLVNGFIEEHVRFVQSHVFEYFLFIELYDLFEKNPDAKFFGAIDSEYTGNQVRFQLLQWAIRLMINLGQLRELSAVLYLKLNNYEKNYLVYFIAENLNFRNKFHPEIKKAINQQNLHNLLIKHLIHFDFVDSSYKDAVTSLINVADDGEIKLFYESILAIFDCMSLDQDKILYRLNQLKSLKSHSSAWEVNPYKVAKLIYLRLKGITLSEDEQILTIERFKNDSNFELKEATDLPNSRQVLSYLMMFVLNLFYGNQFETKKIINTITRLHPKLLKSRKTFSLYLLNLLAQASARVQPDETTDKMENLLAKLYAVDNKVSPTLYTQSVFLSLKAEQSRNRKDFDSALKYAKECLDIYERNDITVNQIFMYNLIINIYKELGEQDKVEEYSYRKISLLDSKNVDLGLFRSTSYI